MSEPEHVAAPDVDGQRRHSTSPSLDHGGGHLTGGQRRSSYRALLGRWCRLADDIGIDEELQRTAASALHRLCRADRDAWDVWIWLALQEHLYREGHDVAWMDEHVRLVCPHCHADLRWEVTPRGTLPRCPSDCDNGHYQHREIAARVRRVFNTAFDADLGEGDLQVL
ncbi:MAG: hypothetical protein ABEI57_05675 [Halapricum sp.]